MSTPILFGIKNCDTIKKARKWLDNQNIAYRFHDYRVDGLSDAQLTQFCQALGWEAVLNKRGTTWRGLDESLKADINEERAKALMLEQPALIKRPILQQEEQFQLGFTEAQYQAAFAG